MRRLPYLFLMVWLGCGESDDPPSRDVAFDVNIDETGLSEERSFRIPEGTRSISVIVEGAPDALYALGVFGMGDGADLVQLPSGAPGPAMQMTYEQEQIGQMPGALFQSIRLGTYTHVYPYRPDQVVLAGTGRLRVASDKPGAATVRIAMPEDAPASVLPLNFYVISDTLAEPTAPAFTAELDRLFAQAGITLRLNGIERLTGTAYERISDFNEPQESPTSQSAMVPSLVADRTTDGLDVFFVEGLPTGVAGLSLGTPGPPSRGSYYFGVLIRGDFPAIELARVTAHEIAHFLALQHVQNRGISGQAYPDPLDDTTPGADNLMEDGTILTPGQAFALTRSALLREL
ncbi:MAG: hypothetical protein SFX73_17630 [Kofleriaceae bacterium]|nr:hypothetical protein [Kofleriaceae bacterium]